MRYPIRIFSEIFENLVAAHAESDEYGFVIFPVGQAVCDDGMQVVGFPGMIKSRQTVGVVAASALAPAGGVEAEARDHVRHPEDVFFSGIAFQSVADDCQFSRFSHAALVPVNIQKIFIRCVDAFANAPVMRRGTEKRRIERGKVRAAKRRGGTCLDSGVSAFMLFRPEPGDVKISFANRGGGLYLETGRC